MQGLSIAMLVSAPISSAALAEDPQPKMFRQVEMARSVERPAADQKRVLAREEMAQVTAGRFVGDGLDRARAFYGDSRAFSRGVIEDFDDSF